MVAALVSQPSVSALEWLVCLAGIMAIERHLKDHASATFSFPTWTRNLTGGLL